MEILLRQMEVLDVGRKQNKGEEGVYADLREDARSVAVQPAAV
jgi:hypothetical protein